MLTYWRAFAFVVFTRLKFPKFQIGRNKQQTLLLYVVFYFYFLHSIFLISRCKDTLFFYTNAHFNILSFKRHCVDRHFYLFFGGKGGGVGKFLFVYFKNFLYLCTRNERGQLGVNTVPTITVLRLFLCCSYVVLRFRT